MPSTFLNFLTTTILTLTTGALLVYVYRLAIRPILVRHNVFPLRHLPSRIEEHFANRGRIRLTDDDAERGFAAFDDDDEEDEGRYHDEERVEGNTRREGRYRDEDVARQPERVEEEQRMEGSPKPTNLSPALERAASPVQPVQNPENSAWQ